MSATERKRGAAMLWNLPGACAGGVLILEASNMTPFVSVLAAAAGAALIALSTASLSRSIAKADLESLCS